MKTRTALILAFAAALPLTAQEKKPPAPKAPAHSPEQSALNKLKQDERNVNRLKELEGVVKKAVKTTDAAKREAERLEKERSAPTTGEAKARLERMKETVDGKDVEKLKNILKDSKPALEEQVKNLREQMKKDGRTPAPASPALEPGPVAGSFDNIAAPEPIPLLKAPGFLTPPIRADRLIKGSSRDPKNPEKMLPDSDPRTRTLVLVGNVSLRQPTMAFDADEADLVFKEGEGPGSTDSKPAKKEGPPSADPVSRPKNQDSPFERIVARGRVRLMIVDKAGKVQVARGGYMIYEEKSGTFVIKDWPEAEFGGKLFRSRFKNAVLRLSDLQAKEPDIDAVGFDGYAVDRPLKPADLPTTHDKPVPAAGPVLPKPSDAPSPAPR